MYKVLISYSFYEKENTKRNLLFFIKHGLQEDMFLLLNVKITDNDNSLYLTEISNKTNCHVTYSENIGYDYKAHLINLELIKALNVKSTHLILMNDSCIGPFYNKTHESNWFDVFESKLKKSKIVGIIDNQGWFNAFNMEDIDIIIHLLKKCRLITYLHACGAENVIRKYFSRPNRINILKIRGWKHRHEPFEAIFVKQNRVGHFAGDICSTARYLSGISKELLEESIIKMNTTIEF